MYGVAVVTIVLTYYLVWTDEDIESQLNSLYRLFRSLYYGSIRDIEILRIALDDGKPREIMYESYRHKRVVLRVINEIHVLYNGDIVEALEKYRVKIYVVSMNHELGIYPNKMFNYTIIYSNYSIHELTLSSYVREKIWRRVNDNIVVVFSDFVRYIIFSIYVILLIRYRRLVF